MPELPEVETVRRGLAPELEGRTVHKVDVLRRDLRTPVPDGFEERVVGRRIDRVSRRAKYLLLELSGGGAVLFHLGMSGHLFVVNGNTPHLPQKHDHVIMAIEGERQLVFNDTRRFGIMDYLQRGADDTDPRLGTLGPEPLGNALSAPGLRAALLKRRGAVKPSLLDQRLVAGLGNIYASEALFRAGISPRRKCCNISSGQTERLVAAIRDVLSEAIEAGGSSLRDFAGADGKLGYFQHRLLVYGRAGLVCQTEDCPGHVKQIIQAGRSTFFCGRCQR
jgi:formamidopyrimidine-DNA glycosylase